MRLGLFLKSFQCVLYIVQTYLLLSYGQTEGDAGYSDGENALDDNFEDIGKDPTFDVPSTNVSVQLGETAVLPCFIEYLGKHKVVWSYNTIALTMDEKRVIDDPRISIVQNEKREWNLQLQSVVPSDAGLYMCTVNTKTVIAKTVWLAVNEPPTILNNASTKDIKVDEGDDLTLTCNAIGNPSPNITWYKLNSQDLINTGPFSNICNSTKVLKGGLHEDVISWGSTLNLKKITRNCEGVYRCQASNGVYPHAYHQITLTVHFRPEIHLPTIRIGQTLGRHTILECTITASPIGMTYWQKDKVKISNDDKTEIELYNEKLHTITLSLRLKNLSRSDYGHYNCIAQNNLGSEVKTVELFEYIDMKTYMISVSTSPATKFPSSKKIPNRIENKLQRHNSNYQINFSSYNSYAELVALSLSMSSQIQSSTIPFYCLCTFSLCLCLYFTVKMTFLL